MKRKFILLIGCVLLGVTIACGIAYEGINLTDDPEDRDREKWALEMTEIARTGQAESSSSSVDGPVGVATAAPTAKSGTAVDLPQETTETQAYSVEAANYDCICSVDGDVEVAFNFKGDTLEVFHSPGVPTEYSKTGEKSYSRSYMGYYILDGEKVDEQKQVVITFTDSGYTMEHFSGDMASPCCVHTFTKK